jgi:hypothetical protein
MFVEHKHTTLVTRGNLHARKSACQPVSFWALWYSEFTTLLEETAQDLVQRAMTEPKDKIKWATSTAKYIVWSDLENGVLPVDENEISAEHAWESLYKNLYEFQDVPFTQFKERLKDHRKQIQILMNRSFNEEQALAHDRRLHPRQTHNQRGEIVFDMTETKLILRHDVEQKLHEGKTPSEFQASRDAYRPFHPKKFKERIYQEVRYQKFLNYLQMKRDAEEQKRKEGKSKTGKRKRAK